jgi:hypothetical protein
MKKISDKIVLFAPENTQLIDEDTNPNKQSVNQNEFINNKPMETSTHTNTNTVTTQQNYRQEPTEAYNGTTNNHSPSQVATPYANEEDQHYTHTNYQNQSSSW